MTTADTDEAAPDTEPFIRLPDPPEDSRDGMVFDHLGKNGNAHHLEVYLRDANASGPFFTGSSLYISPVVTDNPTGLFAPDLFVSFNADQENYRRRNGYVISEQGKAPDFVLEIASCYTGDLDDTVKRNAYAALGITEYWRFDPTGEYNRALLAGDRLVNGHYVPIEVDELVDGVLQGYSAALDLNLRWEDGRLGWHDTTTGQHIATFESEREARITAEARIQELEARLRQQNS